MPKKKGSKKLKRVEAKKLSKEDFEKKVIELAEQGITSEKIGQLLRNEGIHPQEHTKKISQILKGKKLYTNPDLENVKNKLERIIKHLEKNKQDKRALREKDRVFAQRRKLNMYFDRKSA